MKRPWKLVVLLLAVVLSTVLLTSLLRPSKANAVNPTTISFQGKVVNANGTNVTDGTYTFIFKLYTVASGGTTLWTETDSLSVNAGTFQVNLGANCSFFTAATCNNNTPIDFNANPALFLGVTFNSDPAGEMTPRVQLQSVPFAFNADKVGGLSVSQLVQLSPGVQQTGFISVDGNISSAATIQGATLDGTTGINTGATGGTQRIDNSGNLLNIGNITGTSALAIVAGGTAQNLTINASTSGKVQIGASSTGDIELGGGLGSTGCTVTNSNGNLACSGSLTTGTNTVAGSTIFNDGAGNAVTVNTPTLTSSYNLSLPTTAPAVSQCLQTDPTTSSQLVFGDCASIGQKIMQSFNAYGVNQAANATTALNYMVPTSATAVSFALTGTVEFKAAAAGSFRACSILNSAAVTAGTVSVRFRKNGANIDTNNYCTLSTTNTRTNSQQIDSGVETFAAGDTIGVALVSTGLAPATSEHWVNFTIEYGAGGVGPTTLNDAYTNGNTINTTDGSDIAFNLNNTTTDPNFLVNIATGSTGRFAVQNNGADVFSANSTGTTTTGNATFNESATNIVSIATSAVPTTDMFSISNVGHPITANGINAQQIDYYANLGTSGNIASALRVNITNTSATAGTTTNALRVVTTTNASAGDTNGLQIDGITAGTGTDSAINVGTGWTGGLLRYNGNALINGTGILQSVALSGAYSNAVTFSNAGNSFSGSGSGLTGLSATNLSSGTLPSGVVSGSYTNITGVGALAAGSIASGFGTIATGNTITTTSTIQGGTVTSTGTLNGNSLSINGGTFAVSSAGAITASTGATVTGSVSASTSVITPDLTTTGALVINSGAANNVTIDSAGAGTAAINIGGTNATSVGLSRTGETTAINGALTVAQNATFNSNVIMTFAGTENLAITSDLSGNVNGISFIGTPSATAGTTNGAFIQQANSANANGLDNGLTIDNADTNTAIGSAINITNTGGGGYTNYVTTPNFILTGTGQVEGKGFNYFDPSTLTQATGSTGLNAGGATGGNFGGAFDAGAFIGDDDTYDQEFVGSITPAATTNNANAGDDGLWYFNNNAQASFTGGDTSTGGGFYELSDTTTARGGLITEGATPGTQDKPLAAANLPIIQMKVKVSAARATDDLVFGAMDTATAPTANDTLPTNGIVFWTDNSTGTTGWQGVIRTGGVSEATVTCPTTADVTATDYAVGRIVVVNTTTVRFFIDSNISNGAVNFVDCGTATVTAANMPAVAMAMGMYLVHNVGTVATADLDYARFWQDDAAPATPDQAATDVSSEETQADISTASDEATTTDPTTDPATASDLTTTPADSQPPLGTDTDSLTTTPAADGTTQLTNSSGVSEFTFDSSGNASLAGNLSLASATLSGGLTVGGNVNVGGLSTFQQLATFLAKTVFKQDVEFDGHITVAADTAGYASLRTGESSVHVTFTTPYANPPIVTATVTNGQFGQSSVNNVTDQGFDITLSAAATAPTTFNWTAIGVNNPQTATNPLPPPTSP